MRALEFTHHNRGEAWVEDRLNTEVIDGELLLMIPTGECKVALSAAATCALAQDLAGRLGLVVVDPELARTLACNDFHALWATGAPPAVVLQRKFDALVAAVVEKVLTAQPGGPK